MPEADLDLLRAAALTAGEMANSYFGRTPQSWDKPGNAGPVTEADMKIDHALRESLCAARPDYGWLSEETEDDPARLTRERVFIVDPIDGTRAFIAGAPDWGHSLAIAERGEIIAAAVYMPQREALFLARRGAGARCNGTPLSGPRTPLGEANVLARKSDLNPENWAPGAAPRLRPAHRSSLAYRLCLVAQGRFDGMFTLRPTWEWDVAAGCLILAEAGGCVTDLAGIPPRFNQPAPRLSGLLTGSAALCADLRARLPS